MASPVELLTKKILHSHERILVSEKLLFSNQCSMLQLFMVACVLFNTTVNIQSKNDKKFFLDKIVKKKFALETFACSVAKNKFENASKYLLFNTTSTCFIMRSF